MYSLVYTCIYCFVYALISLHVYLFLYMCIYCFICLLIALYLYLLLYTCIYVFMYLCVYVWMHLCICGNPQMCIYAFVLLCKPLATNINFFIIIYLTSDLTDLTDLECAYQYLTILSILMLSSPKLTRNPNFIFVALR